MDSAPLDPTSRLRAKLLAQLAFASPVLVSALAAGCSASGGGDGDGGVTTQMSGQDTGDDQGDQGESGDTAGGQADQGESGSETGQGSESTTGDDPDPCASAVIEDPLILEEEFPECDIDLTLYDYPTVATICVDNPEGLSCERLCGPDGPCGDPWSCSGLDIDSNLQSCAPYYDEEQGLCCSLIVYEEDFGSGGIEGRPFRPDEGSMRVAEIREGAPRTACSGQSALPEQLRSRLADHWRRVALAEHASIASFARFAAQLLHLGAPRELLRDALAAAGDEVRHAQGCFELASRYARRSIGPGGLHTHDGLAGIEGLRAAVRSTFVEGCLFETLAAHEAAQLAELAEDPQVVAHLRQVARDEARHAGLAWRFVAWAVERHPELRPELAASFVRFGAEQVQLDGEASPGPHERALLAHGCPSPRLMATWRRGGLDEVLRPCARALGLELTVASARI